MVNQADKSAKATRLPRVMVGDERLLQVWDPNREVSVVDQTRALTGANCAIFQRMNQAGDIPRVATTVKTSDAKKAIGAFIPASNPEGGPNPPIQSVLTGEVYQAGIFVVDGWNIAASSPSRGRAGTRQEIDYDARMGVEVLTERYQGQIAGVLDGPCGLPQCEALATWQSNRTLGRSRARGC